MISKKDKYLLYHKRQLLQKNPEYNLVSNFENALDPQCPKAVIVPMLKK